MSKMHMSGINMRTLLFIPYDLLCAFWYTGKQNLINKKVAAVREVCATAMKCECVDTDEQCQTVMYVVCSTVSYVINSGHRAGLVVSGWAQTLACSELINQTEVSF